MKKLKQLGTTRKNQKQTKKIIGKVMGSQEKLRKRQEELGKARKHYKRLRTTKNTQEKLGKTKKTLGTTRKHQEK